MAANNANQNNNNNNNKNDDDDLYGDLDLTLEKPRAVLPASETSGTRTGAEERKRKIPPVALSSGRVSNANANANTNANANAKPVPVVAVDVARLRAENESMRERIRVLEEENARLRRNIGTLFRTAKNEIQRKDDQIERFQRQREEQQR